MFLLKKKYKEKYKKIIILFKKKIILGIFAIKSLGWCTVTSKQLESTRRSIINKTSKKVKFIVRKKIYYLKTSKSEKSRMGKGVGRIVKKEVAILNIGDIIFEITYFNFRKSLQALNIIKNKFPTKVKIEFRLFF